MRFVLSLMLLISGVVCLETAGWRYVAAVFSTWMDITSYMIKHFSGNVLVGVAGIGLITLAYVCLNWSVQKASG
jgi:hypothetical protein